MSKKSILINSDETSVKNILVSLRSREKSMAWASSILQDPITDLSNLYFVSVTIPPETKINIRGKSKEFKNCNLNQSYHYFSHRINSFEYDDYDFEHLIVIPEHCLSGQLHFHLIIISKDYKQNISCLIKDLFGIKSKCDNILMKYTTVNDIYKLQAYSWKYPLDWVSNKNELTIDEFNLSIIKKQYEISKFHNFVITKK